MAVGKEIRTKIASIKNTQKITRAMEMVAASKMRKTKDRMQATRPYSKKISQISKLGDTPHQMDIVGVIKIMLDAFSNGSIDQLYVINNEFVNTMTQRPTMTQLLPVVPSSLEKELGGHWDYLYEPGAKEVLDHLLRRYIESIVYQGLVENNACEQAARMVAMKSASDNAGNIIKELQLVYNKARQAAITQEISEIVAGAAAV